MITGWFLIFSKTLNIAKLTTSWSSKEQQPLFARSFSQYFLWFVFQFPFGTRKNGSPAIGLQVKTLEQWGYGYRSRIHYHANYIGANRAGRSNLQYNLDQQYFNRDRLSKSYIESNIQRLREVYTSYIR